MFLLQEVGERACFPLAHEFAAMKLVNTNYRKMHADNQELVKFESLYKKKKSKLLLYSIYCSHLKMLYSPTEEILFWGEKGIIFSAFIGCHGIILNVTVTNGAKHTLNAFYFFHIKRIFSCWHSKADNMVQ